MAGYPCADDGGVCRPDSIAYRRRTVLWRIILACTFMNGPVVIADSLLRLGYRRASSPLRSSHTVSSMPRSVAAVLASSRLATEAYTRPPRRAGTRLSHVRDEPS